VSAQPTQPSSPKTLSTQPQSVAQKPTQPSSSQPSPTQPAPSINNRPQTPANGAGQGQAAPTQPRPTVQPQSVMSQSARPYQSQQPVSPFVRPGGQNTGPLQPARPQFKVNDQTTQSEDQTRSIFLFLTVAVVLLIIGVVIYFAFTGTKKPAENVTPTSTAPQNATTTPLSETTSIKKASLLDVSAVTSENLSDEFNKVLACFKNKNLNEAEKADCQKSDKLVNIGFFLELYYSKNGKYPDVITEIFNLGTYKLLDRYGASIYEYAYNGASNGSYVLCAQYSAGFRCFVPDDAYKTKAKQYINKLK